MSGTQPENKIFLRHYGFNNYYVIDRELPGILDISKNGTNDQWNEFCDKLDMTFKQVNNLQSVVFHCKLAVVAVAIIYVLMMVIVYTFPPPYMILYIIAGMIVFVIALNIVVQGPINDKCITQAMACVKEENEKSALRSISGSAVEVRFVYRKQSSFKCMGYEVDSQECQRYPNIYIEVVSVGNTGNNYIKVNTNSSTVNNYTNVTAKSTGNNYTTVNTDAENTPVAAVASAYVSKKVAPTKNKNYVYPNATVPTLRDQVEEERGRRLEPYVSVPMAKATIIDKPTMQPATKKEEDLPSAYVTKK